MEYLRHESTNPVGGRKRIKLSLIPKQTFRLSLTLVFLKKKFSVEKRISSVLESQWKTDTIESWSEAH